MSTLMTPKTNPSSEAGVAKQRVLAKEPKACIKEYVISRSTTAYRIVRRSSAVWKHLSDIHVDSEKAWIDAAVRLSSSPEATCKDSLQVQGGAEVTEEAAEPTPVKEDVCANTAEKSGTYAQAAADVPHVGTASVTSTTATTPAKTSMTESRELEAEPAAPPVAKNGAAGWIPVDKTMPPAGKNVAMLVEDATVAIHGWATAGYFHSGSSGWWHGVPGDYRSCRAQRWTVTHWAHLPQIPVSEAFDE